MTNTCSEVVTLKAGEQLPLDSPDTVYYLTVGTLEVFGVQRNAGAQIGPRTFVCQVDAGGLAWGVTPTEGGEVSLLALATDDVTLLRIRAADLVTQGNPAFAKALAGPLDQWITGLSQGVTRFIQPRQATKHWIAAGEELALAENERASSHKGVVWVLLADGNGRFIDVCDVQSPGGNTMVPLTQHTWLREDGVRRLRGFVTEAVLQVAGWSNRLDAFHGWVAYALRFTYRNEATAERARLEKRAGQIATDTEKTLFKFAKLLSAKAPYKPGIDAEDALFECCAMVGGALGLTMVPPPTARRRRTEDPPLNIEDIARYSLVRARQVALRGAWWTEDNGPLVCFLKEDKNPVALIADKNRGYRFTEPVSGRSELVTERNVDDLSPVAYTFYPPLPDRKVEIRDILSFGLGRCKFDVFMVLLTGALGGLVGTGIPIATGYVFDTVIPGHQQTQLLQVGMALVVAALATGVFRLTSDIATLRIEGKIAGILQAAVLDRLLRLPNTFFAGYSAGDLASRTMVVDAVRKSLTGVVLASVLAGVFSLFSFGLLFFYQPMAALLASLLLIVMLGLTVVTGAAQLNAVMQGEAMSGNINSMVLEIISGITKLRLAGAEIRAFNRWGGDFGEMRNRMVKSKAITNRFTVFSSWYDVMCSAAIYAMIAYMAGDEMTTGSFLAFIGAFTTFLGAVSQMSKAIIQVYQVRPLWDRAKPIFAALPENSGTKTDPGQLTGKFEITQATFRYGRDLPRVLNGLSIEGEPGEFIAVVGPSGSGKSTVMKLLLGFEKPETGSVLFDGRDLKGVDVQLVRRQIGVVLQSGKLMPGTIYENIKGATYATVDDAWEAAKMAGLHTDIKAMPMGMHTVLTEGTAALSGGQVQRILLARAIVAKPRLLLLDEATSALDNRTQAVVTESLDRLSVTRVVIAHRLSTIMKADRIYVVKEGKVAETGSYEQLMARNGVFAELARRQQL
ncbi:MAG: NHLP bacteriocin export ABC transporter permease/ATPase subunit [Alphaproteobacteria bacterium]